MKEGVPPRPATLLTLAAAFLSPLAVVWARPTSFGLSGYVAGHIALETISIVVAAIVFAIGWHTAEPSRTPGVSVLACLFLAVALLDLAHLLSFQGMPDFVSPSDPSKAIYFWLAARLTAAVALLLFALVRPVEGRRTGLLVGSLAWVGLVAWVVLWHQRWLPEVFAPGVGLTTTKRLVEVAVVGLGLVTLGVVLEGKGSGRRDLLAAAALALALSEVPFCLYSSVSDGFNLVGHVEKVIAYAFLYRAIFLEAVREPYARLEDSLDALSRSEARFRELGDTVEEVIFLRDAATRRVLYVSPAYEKIFGQPCAELLADPAAMLRVTHPEDLQRVKATQAAQSERETAFEFRVVRPDGTMRWVAARTRPVHDAAGAIYRIAGVTRDVTEEKLLHAQLITAQKDETVARLASGIAHDFNNLLTVILSSATLAGESKAVGTDAELREDLSQISFAARRAQGLTRQLLSFVRRDASTTRVVDVGSVAQGLESMLRRLLGKQIEIHTEVAPGAHPVRMDPGQLEQLIVNFAVNARDAMPAGGRLRIVVADATAADLERHGWKLERGPQVLLSAIDSGEGMTEEVRRKACEPFFTTKPVGLGTGLGLSTCSSIVRGLHGELGLESRLGSGTRVDVLLPRAGQPVTAELPVLSGRGETVLVVDAEEFVRRSAVRALQAHGYKVLEAASLDEALGVAEGPTLDLVVTDLAIPGLDGAALTSRLRAQHGGLKVLYTSGSALDSTPKPMLPKPFGADQLARAVREALDAPVL